ncbi:hypothetical protein HKD37_11G030745 [Glycine soja]|nr:hypothetical protein GmHk_11G031327 [Glycine max]
MSLNSEHSKYHFGIHYQLIITACVALLRWYETQGPLKVSAFIPPIIVCRKKLITDYRSIQQKQ